MKQQKEQRAALASLEQQRKINGNESQVSLPNSSNTRGKSHETEKDCNSHLITENYEKYK
eukprot:752996-Hanusia_phi.AAC.1